MLSLLLNIVPPGTILEDSYQVIMDLLGSFITKSSAAKQWPCKSHDALSDPSSKYCPLCSLWRQQQPLQTVKTTVVDRAQPQNSITFTPGENGASSMLPTVTLHLIDLSDWLVFGCSPVCTYSTVFLQNVVNSANPFCD